MKVIQWGLPIVLLLIACLNFNTSQNLTLWMGSIVVTEYGHWFALFSIVLIAILYPNRVAMLCLVVAAGIYLIPSYQLYSNFRVWEKGLVQSFGTPAKIAAQGNDKHLPNLLRLFSIPLRKPKPETFVYANRNGELLSLDFFKTARPHAPFVVSVHGGGWDSGDRTQFAEMNQFLADQGYAVASVDYRLAPHYQWPAPKEDVESAVQYLKMHAADLGIDPDQWVIFGRSAGGQIAERVAYEIAKIPGLKGCIAFYAPADMNFAYEFGKEDDILKSPALLRSFLGGSPATALSNYDDASPILFVDNEAVPTLLMHGPRDPLVWSRQSERLFAKLQYSHVKSEFIRMPWATHGFDFNLNGPGGQIATYSITKFLEGVFQP